MPDPTPTSRAARRAESTKRRVDKARLRADLFDLIVSGYSHGQVAAALGLSIATVRREVDRAIEARAGEAPTRFVVLQQARLHKALRVVDGALEDGNLKAVGPLTKLLTQLDRYHAIATRLPPCAPALPNLAPTPLALTDEREIVAKKGA